MFTRNGTISLFALGVTLAAACTKESSRPAASVDSAKTMPAIDTVEVAQWGQEKYLIYLPLYVAMEEGYFDRNRIHVRIKFSGNDDQVFAAVMARQADVGVGDPAFAAIARERGADAFVIGTIVNSVAIWGVAKRLSGHCKSGH